MSSNKKMRLAARIISMLLIIVMVSEEFLGSGTIVLAAQQEEISVLEENADSGMEETGNGEETEETDISETEEYETEKLDILFEMEEKREQSGKHYRLSDGSIMATDYGMDIHYQKDGQWEDIDNRFVYEAAASDDSMEGFATAKGDVQFKFAPDAAQGDVVRASSGAYSVSFEFLGDAAAEDTEHIETEAAQEEQSEETAVVSENEEAVTEKADSVSEAAAVSGEAGIIAEEAGAVPEETGAVPEETEAVPITFIKGELLNAETAAEALSGTAAGASVLAFSEEEGIEIVAVAGLLSSTEGSGVAVLQEASDGQEGLWAEVGNARVDAEEETSLMKQAALEHVVTSVGYENVLPDISLQYVAAGSTLKEYILVHAPQESYVYHFRMDLEHLVPQMQEDGSILLLDEESSEAVYEIPAAYMTDADGAYSEAVDMELSEEPDGTYLLTVTADDEWLGAQDRAFPVQIDPTLNKRLTSSSNVRGNYVREGKPTLASTNYGEMYVGYDSSGNKNMKTFIQLKNLPQLPKDSVICSAVFNMAVLSFSQVAWTRLNIRAQEVKNTTWDSKYTWNNQPSSETLIIDQRTITSSELYKYVGWNITSLVKAHYEAGNEEDSILAFSLAAYGTMSNTKCANTALNLLWDGAEPIFQIFYRDTRGVEDYYTYQTQSLGNAGTGYISDYTSQLTVTKTVASYDSTVMPYEVGLVYNSVYSDGYFTNGGDIHSVDFSKMKIGAGWKLTLQESVVPVTVTDTDGTATYLVYNDADGTEHYFKVSESDSTKYEDEDGLNLTIKKSGTTYTMTDKKDNVKVFTNGYLTSVADANGNKIRIVYNSDNQITSVTSTPKGGTEETIFWIRYYDTYRLAEIEDYAGRKVRFIHGTNANGDFQLEKILRYDASWTTVNVIQAEYSYDAGNLRMSHAYDTESGTGVQYLFWKSVTGYRMYEYWEYAASSISGTQTVGPKARTWTLQMRQARYRFSGADGLIDTEDDVINNYLFNSAGQTINARSENETTKQLLGVTASAYTKNSGTSKTNNRMNGSISSGQSGVNLLVNGGFEKAGTTATAADSWEHYVSGGAVACKDSSSGLNVSGEKHYNLFGSSTSAVCIIYQDVTVTKGDTYTFSAYVNTRYAAEFGENSGIYLYARQNSDQVLAAESIRLDHHTSASMDGGWQRLSTTFTAQISGTIRFSICSSRVYGTVMVDDAQLEKGDAASRFNHVYNGSFEKAGAGWDTSGTGTREATGDDQRHGNYSLRMIASVPEDTLCAWQTINLYKGSDTTFLLSGWSIGNSVPDLEPEIAGKTDTALRYWGMTLTLNYADGTAPEHFNLPFNEYATNWQYAAMSITPKAADKTITTAVLKLYYQNNANTVYFDNISLIEEPAQTYTYDKDGNLTSVKSNGNGEDAYSFNEATQNLMKVATEGSGTYEYSYDNPGNKHLPTSIKNDTVTMDVTYDTTGQTKGTTLRNNSGGTALTMTSTAAYEDGLLTAVTDNTGASTTYTYDDSRRLFTATDAAGTQTVTYYDDVWNRAKLSYQNKKISVGNTYTGGNLTQIKRSGYSTPGNKNTGVAQEYNFTYDAFGKMTAVKIGSQSIADYTYNANNGSLARIEYGWTDTPEAGVVYTYDALDRVEEIKYYDNSTLKSVRYGYQYSSDGSLSGITKDGELLYTYDYDTLGRLIHSSMLEDGKMVLYTDHQYDTSDRILSQNWQIGTDGFQETYSYNQKDGTLATMTTAGDTLSFAYDGLKRLDTRTSPALAVDYGYRDISSTKTTTQVKTIQYLKPGTTTSVLPKLTYTYDTLGNIASVTPYGKRTVTYTYDAQNQLVSETDGQNTVDYTYDTYGNIRSIHYEYMNGDSGCSYAFTYGGNVNWADQLDTVTYTDINGKTVSGTLTYDQMGNPEKYFNGHANWNLTWEYGRQLKGATDGTDTISYTYDVDGTRQTKTVNGVEHQYTTLDGKVVREAFGDVTVDYFYDNEGKPYKIVVDDNGTVTSGYYVLNQQGDVIAILNSSGTQEVVYEYNAWGRITREDSVQANGNAASTTSPLETYNALKYRGYYYDAETGFYYVSSRYYDPVLGRFISADTTDVLIVNSIALTNKNLYAYCDNNPVMRKDETGECWITVGIMAIGGAIGAAVSAVSSAITQKALTGTINLKSVIVAAGSGFVSGAVAASPLGLTGQVVAGGIIGGLSYMADCAVNNKSVKLDEMVVSIGMGAVSGRIGGSGANQNMALTNTIKTSIKTTTKMATRSCTSYAAKRIASTTAWRNNVLSVTAWSSSARFAAGTGVSNGVTNGWSRIKSWFSNLFE